MRPNRLVLSLVLPSALVLCLAPARMAAAAPSIEQGKVQLYLLHMDPLNVDARDYTRASWGGGGNVVVPLPPLGNFFAGVFGLDIANMLSETIELQDPITRLRVKQETNQSYTRIYLGGRAGPHGYGFLRPHLGTNVALVIYDIGTQLVVPDDSNPENEIRQDLGSRTETALGWDFTAGVDLNIVNRIPVELGVRWLKSFNVPQQLGAGAVTVHPAYMQYYLGVGASFRALSGVK